MLALRMMSGGDLSHYIKHTKKKGKDGKEPIPGLKKDAVQFYVASTGRAGWAGLTGLAVCVAVCLRGCLCLSVCDLSVYLSGL